MFAGPKSQVMDMGPKSQVPSRISKCREINNQYLNRNRQKTSNISNNTISQSVTSHNTYNCDHSTTSFTSLFILQFDPQNLGVHVVPEINTCDSSHGNGVFPAHSETSTRSLSSLHAKNKEQ